MSNHQKVSLMFQLLIDEKHRRMAEKLKDMTDAELDAAIAEAEQEFVKWTASV